MIVKMTIKTEEKVKKMLWDEFNKEYSNDDYKRLLIKRSKSFGLPFVGHQMTLLMSVN